MIPPFIQTSIVLPILLRFLPPFREVDERVGFLQENRACLEKSQYLDLYREVNEIYIDDHC